MLLHSFLLALFLFTSSAYAFDACAPDAKTTYAPIEKNIVGLIYKIEQCGKKPSYVFGTYHSDAPELKPIFEMLKPYLKEADTALFEMVLNQPTQIEVITLMTFPPSQPKGLVDIVGQETFSALMKEIGSDEMPAFLVNRLRPWAAGMMLGYPKNRGDGILLDDRIQKFAGKEGAQLIALETPKEAFKLFLAMPEKDQLAVLHEGLADLKEGRELADVMEKAYFTQDMPSLYKIAQQSMEMIDDKSLADSIENEIIDERNKRMGKNAMAYLDKGGAFIAVGAFHLPGKSGLLQQFEKAGYFVTPVTVK